jgi:sulfate permease, SulP family
MRSWGIFPTLRGYRASWLGADVLGGLTLIAVALPSQLATAQLANLPVVTGLYTFVAGSLLYGLFGKSRHLSVGADSTIAPVLATGVASIAVVGTAGYATAMGVAALMVGVLLVAVGLLKFGWISELLSTPVVTGLLAGISVEIIVRQLPTVLGVPGGGSSTISRVRDVVDRLGQANGWSVGIAVGVLVVVIVARLIDHRPPGVLAALVLSTVAVDVLSLASHHGVAVLGTVHGGLPPLRFPTIPWSQFVRLISTALTVTFLCIAQTAATVRDSGHTDQGPEDFNRDLVAVGAGSIAAGLVGGMAVDASPPNTAIATAAGTRSQLANVLAALVVLVVALVFTAPLADVPKAMLGATLVYIATKLFRVGELRKILRFDRTEFALAAAALVGVALIGIEQGVLLAMVLSLLERTRRSARPPDAILGRKPGSDHWIPIDIGRPAEQVPGILVYLVYAPVWYGNANYLHVRINTLVRQAPGPLHAVVLDAGGMSDLDYTGLEALGALTSELEQRGVTLAIARASHLVHHDLKHGELLQQVGADHLFDSVEDAVVSLTPQLK